MENKRVAIIGTAGVPARYGGFETLAENLISHLSKEYKLTIFCSGKIYKEKLKEYKGAELKYINLNANGVESVLYDIISIIYSLRFADTLLILGVSGCIILPFVKLVSRQKKIVINIDGLEWQRPKWHRLAKWFLKLSEKLAVKYGDVIVADNKAIQDYIVKEYGKKSELIAYGGDHTTKEPLSDRVVELYPFLNRNKYAFTVCRIEPENNIHLILEAFSEYKDLNLVIVGNWDKSLYGQRLRKKYSAFRNIFLLETIYDQKILNAIRSNCYIYIHGHSAGGTNPSLVEAMYLGLPIFAYGVEYNMITTYYKAKYFKTKDELIELLNKTTYLELREIGINMKIIAEKEYRWEKISKQYKNIIDD